jgi:hypothetical protein
VLLIHFLGKQFQTVLIGNVLDHNSRSTIFLNIVVINLENSLVYIVVFAVVIIIRIELIIGAVSEGIVE